MTVTPQEVPLTDQYFFAPWSCLNESELEDLSRLAEQLRDGVRNIKEKE